MDKIILYHGSPNQEITPQFGLGDEKHDYGKGFYLTANIELAKEWAVYRPDASNGWVHQYELDPSDLNILDFDEQNVLSWLAELMKHRDAADSKRYRLLSEQFINKYGISTDAYDITKGWRANASYFYIAKAFVRDEVDVDILEELLALGGLGIQYCLKTKKCSALCFKQLEREVTSMGAYAKAYLDEVVETQGKLFDYVAAQFPDSDTEDFILAYMKSKTRRYIDEAQAFVCTMNARDLWEYFCRIDEYSLKEGASLKGFLPDWMGEFYAYYQWEYDLPSREVVEKVPIDYLKKAYAGLHDLDLELAVKKVGKQ